MSQLRSVPAEGLPPLLDTPAQFLHAARSLSQGVGPFAIDTERASAYRYDDRAFLVQIRRKGAGTWLLDPEGGREALSRALAPVLNGAEWVVHAAPSDLPCLAWLGWHAGSLFDTELAARMAGFDHPNLGTMTQLLLDVDLEKGYGDADWSARPIPEKQLNYAALDVELLLELAEVLTEILDASGKLDWAYQEFDHILGQHAQITKPSAPRWQDLRGVATLSTPAQLNAVRALWTHRDRMARAKDMAPGKILPNKVVVELARQIPRSEPALRRTKGFPRNKPNQSQKWFTVLETAMRTDPQTWPTSAGTRGLIPSKTTWSREYPELWDLYQDIRGDLELLAETVGMQADTMIRSEDIRKIIWHACAPAPSARAGDNGAGAIKHAREIPTALQDYGARPWQIELVAPLLVRKLFHSE